MGKLVSPEAKERKRQYNVAFLREWRLRNKAEGRPVNGTYTRDKKAARDAERMRIFGLTKEEFLSMLDHQRGRCAICGCDIAGFDVYASGRKVTRCHVDHCHSTGAVRGLLCGHCNRGLGLFRDDPALFITAVEYLTSERTCERT